MSHTLTPTLAAGNPSPEQHHDPMHNTPRNSLLALLGMQSLLVHAITAAARLKLADTLGEQTLSLEVLARQSGCRPQALKRLLRALASCGIFFETEEGYRNTPLSATLHSERPDSLHGWACFMGSAQVNRCFEQLDVALAADGPVFDKIYGQPFFDYLGQDAEARDIFARAMTSYSASGLDDALAAFDFSASGQLFDIGSGLGKFLSGILDANPHLTGTLFDLPEVITQIDRQTGGLNPRLTWQAGDFFSGIPAGADTYILRHVLHDWSDEQALQILRNCRRAMHADAQLLIFEHLLAGDNQPDYAKFLDLVMLTFLNGRERSEAEYRHLLEQADLRLEQRIKTPGFHTLLVVKPR
ncbi:methyltransferase [Enterobacter sp. Cy-643]|uniref:methyltransferase n=1 Tax=Enterobacter sp. Cy-643 TaxID=2608346 RepID=UPI00141F874A|nr:methyltransferase [Enterobacter sp. Cy-643]